MKVAVRVDYKADRKEPLGALMRRLLSAFESAGLLAEVSASFSDSPVSGGVSAIDRAVKKVPDAQRFVMSGPVFPGDPSSRRIANAAPSESFPLPLLLGLCDGVPRSLPFHSVAVSLSHPDFGDLAMPAIGLPATGVMVGDNWWVNGRNRSLSLVYVVEGAAEARTLPAPALGVADVLAALGKPKKTTQIVVGPSAPAQAGDAPPIPAITEIVRRYRSEMPDMLGRLDLPHSLPPLPAALRLAPGSGPLKPALSAVFGPRGFDCRGETGVFTLRRRTSANHVVSLVFDVGTWSRMVTAFYKLEGPGFEASIPLPAGDISVQQYPIGDSSNWERILANVAVVVDALDRTFLPEIEAAAGPAPAWFQRS